MDVDCIPFKKTGRFTALICDYIDQQEALRPFYNRFPDLDNFEAQIEEKASNFPDSSRDVLYQSLLNQYAGTQTSKKTQDHLKQLKEPITFTVVTGHQLNLFTGPLYFLYKIVTTINLAKSLKARYPKYNFVPVYWMATEDHDFDEINHFNFRGRKIQWNQKTTGAVGHLSTQGLDEVYQAFADALGNTVNAKVLKELFGRAYLEQATLAKATRFLVNSLFGDYGLVILDGDDHELKKSLVPYAKKDIFERVPFGQVTKSVAALGELSKDYAIQVNPREINFFYMSNGVRERIVEKNGQYVINGTSIQFTTAQLQHELENYPGRFSPNVIMRPLYQEIVLPNLCYIGGGGEIAYWLELKAMFGAMKIAFPMLLLRNSVLVVYKKQEEKLHKLGLKPADLFMGQPSLINKKVREISNIDIDLTPQKQVLQAQFNALYELASQTDVSFLGAVKAQETKQKRGLDLLEKRLLKAQKRKLRDQVARMVEIQDQLFPNKSLQERNQNFAELYLETGEKLVPLLLQVLDPLKQGFTILTIDHNQ